MLLTDEEMQKAKNIELCQTGGDCENCSVECFKIAKAQHQKDIEWLEEPCKEHQIDSDDTPLELLYYQKSGIRGKVGQWRYLHRKDCPECWKEFKTL